MASPETISPPTLRIIDANLNRIGEGLHLLEDIARLLLNDSGLTRQLKTLRHELLISDGPFQQQLLEARDAKSDVGVNISEEKERELPLLVVANSRRVQESLRTLEELAKLPNTMPQLDSARFKQARFNLYSIEQELLSKLLRQDKTKQISGVYLIIDTQALQGRSHIEVATQAIRGGARVVQLRDKLLSKTELLPIAQELRNTCAEGNVLFIMNDYLDLALATNADGLHLGQDDLPVTAARKLLPMDKIIGCSTTTVDQAVTAQAEGADYIAVGSIYPTSSKETAKVVGRNRLQEIRQAVTLPLVAIGGITKDTAHEVMTAGADAIAIISAILQAEDIATATGQIVNTLESQQ